MSRPFELAFRREFTGRWRELYAYLHRLTGDPDAAEDVAQEAFVRLYRRGAMPDDVGAWLVSVAHNLLRDSGRKRDRRRKLLRVRSEEL
ncbi:MAG TPA: sigma factor, partial [Longimicrobiales bacterium]|nr:sigma factor [Longimicrobiales bacterium]